MPIYEYCCRKCREKCEILLKNLEEKPLCPSCGSGNLEKVLSQFSVNSVSTEVPDCAAGSCEGFSKGSCGSGLCSGK